MARAGVATKKAWEEEERREMRARTRRAPQVKRPRAIFCGGAVGGKEGGREEDDDGVEEGGTRRHCQIRGGIQQPFSDGQSVCFMCICETRQGNEKDKRQRLRKESSVCRREQESKRATGGLDQNRSWLPRRRGNILRARLGTLASS